MFSDAAGLTEHFPDISLTSSLVLFLTIVLVSGAFECETAARRHLLHLKPDLE